MEKQIMARPPLNIPAIVGKYHKGGIIERAVVLLITLNNAHFCLQYQKLALPEYYKPMFKQMLVLH